ncbi:aldehyde dehydrogenase family protein [Hymenobacter taeanensis]|uniref:aldehyde dehydrogenase (NAD(+)) n=1 Tax=Hymenobacter taeanensis TaxID=2735321 RepID=A0A6M6BFS5_9BACT|nr:MULTISPECIES: aldehyde dehydrogenase family protein [Hymenobacter]QJX46093.1 aldehyde dehydrogenase family protein [Hymenobacter taeanensis]UOQ79947.1 aldehyde dehydrogenase family protein [Hymenobacter sp. 5414T-23]
MKQALEEAAATGTDVQDHDHHGIRQVLQELGVEAQSAAWSTGLRWGSSTENARAIHSPTDGRLIGSVAFATTADYDQVVKTAQEAFQTWRLVPAPKRGDIVRQIGNKLRQYKEPLGKLVSYEMGKILQEGLGEVQEMIDICDFAVGLSRQLTGYTMHSERPAHRMYEQYHPLGVVGIISAFNFPVAVWSWNAMLAAVCGDVCIWKPSEKTPLVAVAVQHILKEVLQENELPEGIFNLIIGDAEIGAAMAADGRVPLVSATGSTRMGKKVGEVVGGRLGRALLELGGNNAIILTEHADLDMAMRAVVFGAVGTAGQRCTTTRRLIIHESIFEDVKARLLKIYPNLPIGHPLQDGNLVGPLIDKAAVEGFTKALEAVQQEGGKLLIGGEVLEGAGYETGTYVKPALVEARNEYHTVQEETFAPILYLIKYSGGVEEAIAVQNGVRQGLSSSIFSLNMRETETYLSHAGSDCGIANVNIGTSGAEIGGAFGGEKETGGGRESGSDAWRIYMRRQTNTINYSNQLPLAQGIKFDV